MTLWAWLVMPALCATYRLRSTLSASALRSERLHNQTPRSCPSGCKAARFFVWGSCWGDRGDYLAKKLRALVINSTRTKKA